MLDAAQDLVRPNMVPSDQLWFESHTLDMAYLYAHSHRLSEDDLVEMWTRLFPNGRGFAEEGVAWRHGHAVGALGVNPDVVHRAIRPDERPLK